MLYLRDQTGMGEVKKIAIGDGHSFYTNPVWSPDSKRLAFNDQHVNLWYVDIATGKNVKVDSNPYVTPDDVLNASLSPDSKWLAFVKQLDNRLRAVFLYSLDTGKANQVTDGLGDTRYTAFDKSGKYVFFTASTDLGRAIRFADMTGIGRQTT